MNVTRKILIIFIATLLSLFLLIIGMFLYLRIATNTGISISSPKEYLDYRHKTDLYKSVSVDDTIMSEVIEYAPDSMIRRIVETDKKDVIVFFSAVGCTGCDEMYPYLKKVAKEYKQNYTFLMNKCQMGNQKFQKYRYIIIDVFPTTIVFKGGKEHKRFSDPIDMDEWFKSEIKRNSHNN